ncbi:peptidase [Stenotrophomonas sp. ESTM1D_MKCIP4_1]|uniref:M3 family metallopeptidase n=1 Tax=Stenotrophomonas sp. ESTM1D_MKCIP4_1 TaxID=2072414 RepID=UPI000D53CF3F|nr:M3 family metallopeptidase [Stenotrophomonas sp. ESTM1D_MKCIP4_1]AWH55118.1 peptidase [Stenotrophomonas sp. ESTM1D_MKCIP4_1]
MNTRRTRSITAAIMLLLTASTASAQTLHADDRAYFSDAAAEQAARATLAASIASLRDSGPTDPATRVAQAERLLGQCQRHRAYLHLQAARDARDARPVQAQRDAADLCDVAASIARKALVDAPTDAGWMAPYAWLRARALGSTGISTPPRAAGLDDAVDEVASPAMDAFARLQRQLLRHASYPAFPSNGTLLDSRKDSVALSRHPDRALREAGWKGYWQGVSSQRDAMASTLLALVQVNDRASQLQGHGSAPEHSYTRMGLDAEAVHATLAAVRRHAPQRRAYQQALLQHAERMGHADAQIWDLSLPDAGFVPPVLTWEQVRDTATDAMQGLGPAYTGEVHALLDPAQRRMDMAGTLGPRTGDAFPVAAPGVPSLLFVGERRGTLESDVEVVHEAGHAVHAQWMERANVSPFYRNGTSWLNEAYAIFNELKFRDQLYQQAQDPRAKAYYLKSLLDDIVLQVFIASEEAQLEESIYQGVAAGTLGTADDLDALTLDVLSGYGMMAQRYPALGATWETKRLMYEDPLYLANYLFAGLVAVQLYVQEQLDPQGFRQRYLAVLSEGFDRAPQEQVAQLLGHAPDWSALVDADLQVFDVQVARLHALHAQIEGGAL